MPPSSLPAMPTNSVFRTLLAVLRLNQDKELVVQLFADQGMVVTKSKIKAWSTPPGEYQKAFRAMPLAALEAFIEALKNARLVEDSEHDR